MFLLLPVSKIYEYLVILSRLLTFHECVFSSAYVSLTCFWLCLLLTSYEPFYDLTFSEGRQDMGASAHASVYRNHLRYLTSFYSKGEQPLNKMAKWGLFFI